MKLIESLVLPTMSVCSVPDVTCTAHFFSQKVDCIAYLRHCPLNCVLMLRQVLCTVTMIFMGTDNDVPAPLLCPLDCFVIYQAVIKPRSIQNVFSDYYC